ncbi:MAG: hypothetical protein GY860_24860 [Desulfobacteraceae bacterium]|nr:hypothetical protein [Desulfobacteraceae bacterium]
MEKRVLVPVAQGTEEMEAITIIDVLRRAGAHNLRDSKALEIFLEKQAARQKFYGAICASPALVLHHHGLVTPGKVTCHPGFVDLIDNGNIVESSVVVDKNCITSRGQRF